MSSSLNVNEKYFTIYYQLWRILPGPNDLISNNAEIATFDYEEFTRSVIEFFEQFCEPRFQIANITPKELLVIDTKDESYECNDCDWDGMCGCFYEIMNDSCRINLSNNMYIRLEVLYNPI